MNRMFQEDPKIPRIYGLPKIHKPGNRRNNRTLVQVTDQQAERPSRRTRTVRPNYEHTRIHREGEEHSTHQGQSAGLVRRRGALSQCPGKTTGRHLHKSGKAVHGTDTILVLRSFLPANIWHSNELHTIPIHCQLIRMKEQAEVLKALP
jgi:hypothetical protein